MNYLAHLYLAGNSTSLIIGNFIADHIKGSIIDNYDAEIRRGILMHRSIDHFTDTHPVVRKSIERLRPGYRKYSGVIIDMYYDHFLASGWDQYCNTGLKEFTESRYTVLSEHYHILPPRAQRILPYMQRDNWLMAYATIDGLHGALTGMSRRTTFLSRMEHAIDDLQKSYENYKEEFLVFFPQLCRFAETSLSDPLMTRW